MHIKNQNIQEYLYVKFLYIYQRPTKSGLSLGSVTGCIQPPPSVLLTSNQQSCCFSNLIYVLRSTIITEIVLIISISYRILNILN